MNWFKRIMLVLAVVGMIAAIALYRMLSSPSLTPYAVLQPPADSSDTGRVTAQYLGTTTILFDDGKTRIMLDGFFSRPSIWQLLTGKIAPDNNRIDHALNKAGIKGVAAIFVAHSHHDHAMDTARVARRTGAIVFGSDSTHSVARGEDLPLQQFTRFEDGKTYTIDDFAVTVFQTPHLPGVAFPGTVDSPLRLPARVSDYREGGNYSFLVRRGAASILIVPSGNFIPGNFKNVRANTVFLGIGGLGKQPATFAANYWREVVQAVGAKVVIPIHWDDFTRSLAEPLRPMPYALDDFDRSMITLLAMAKRDGVQMRLPVAFEETCLDCAMAQK